jgi:lipopolysaccharide transport system permease protein
MQQFKTHPLEIARSIWGNGALIFALIKRDVVGRYRGSLFGICWSFFNPLLMLLVYTFVFGVVFEARWGSVGGSKSDFAIALFAGLIVFNLFSECASRAPTLITSNANFVKKVVFPLEILSCVAVGAAVFHFLISLLVWLLCFWALKGSFYPQSLLVPVALIPLLAFTLGFSWLISSLGVFIRDIAQIIALVVSISMFLSPVFYPISALPPIAQKIMVWSPIAQAIEGVRGLLLSGLLPNVSGYILQLVLSCVFAWGCFAWFQRSRRAFADVL